MNRGAWVGASSGLVSYEGLTFQIQKAAKDPATKAIVLDMQSPGGEAVGAFECATVVRAVAKEKPIVAVVNGMAASAAYAIASACRAIVSIDTGISGSIGVVMMHADYSRAIDKAGITPTLIHAGAHKVDGNPYQPLPAGVKSDLQAEVDAFYEKFLETVAAGRGKRLTAKAARATEARCLIGRDALAAGLVDDTGTFADVIANVRKFDVMTRSSLFSASLPPAPSVSLSTFTDLHTMPTPAPTTPPAKRHKIDRVAIFSRLNAATDTEEQTNPPPERAVSIDRNSIFARVAGTVPAPAGSALNRREIYSRLNSAVATSDETVAADVPPHATARHPRSTGSRAIFERLNSSIQN